VFENVGIDIDVGNIQTPSWTILMGSGAVFDAKSFKPPKEGLEISATRMRLAYTAAA